METPLQSPQQRPRTTPRTLRNPRSGVPTALPAALSSPSRGAIRSRENAGNRSSNATSLNIESDSTDAYFDNSADVSLKQWTTNHIEWSYEGVSSLSDNSGNTPVSERSALLGKVIAHTKFRIDVVFNSQHSALADWQTDLEDRLRIRADEDTFVSGTNREAEPHFRVYIATVIGDQEDYRSSRDVVPKDANIFLGIKPRDESAGRRHAYQDWVWETSTTHVFTDDFSFCEIRLPSIPVLLENTRIREEDAFTLVLRLQAPATEASDFSADIGKQMIDRNLMLGLRSLLDDANTGDVKFICLEKQVNPSTSDQVEISTGSRYRKRTLFAHSGILKHRSEYLADCIKFSSEREGDSTGKRHPTATTDRTIQIIRCLDVDYITIYWLLHYIYTGEVDFKDEQDFTDSTDLQLYKINARFARRLESQQADGHEWEWREADPFQVGQFGSTDGSDDDNATVKSASTMRSSASTSPHQHSKPSVTASVHSGSAKPLRTPSDKQRAVFPTTNAGGSRSSRPSLATGSGTTQRHTSGRKLSSPTTPLHQPYIRPVPIPDPHEHPVGPVPPASAFATYALAHRYQLDDLARLAQDHLLACLTPHGACSLLMASFRFQELHVLVEDYVIANWEAIQESPAFLETIQEVASGSWGSEGGSCLHSLFGRFHGVALPSM